MYVACVVKHMFILRCLTALSHWLHPSTVPLQCWLQKAAGTVTFLHIAAHNAGASVQPTYEPVYCSLRQ